MQSSATPSESVVTTINGHRPRKILESKEAIVLDDFLPEDAYQRIHDYALRADYEYVNAKGAVSRAWHIQDGSPLRSTFNLFYYAEGQRKPFGNHVYPSNTALDEFADHLLAIQPFVEHLIGKQGSEWGHMTATAWLYPHGTGLHLHDDGAGVYTGAYAYFLNPTWRPHWGGLNLMIEAEGNQVVHDFRNSCDPMEFYRAKWLHGNNLDEMLMEHGLARCIFPKRNRIVFIANDAYHAVTRVNESSGDNIRMSLAGFFNRKK